MRMYLGTQPLDKAIIGGNAGMLRVGFELFVLPEGYIQLEYIESTGTQTIDTGVIASNSVGFVTEFQYTELKTAANFCQVYSDNNTWQIIPLMMTSYSVFVDEMSFYGGYNTGIKYKAADLEKHTLSFNKNGDFAIKFDDVDVGKNIPDYSTESATITFNLFCRKLATGEKNEYGKIKLYSCLMYDSGTMIRNFIPAQRDSDSKIGLYDTVSKTFFTDANGGNFTGGDPV